MPPAGASGARGRGKMVVLVLVTVLVFAALSIAAVLILSTPPQQPPPAALDRVSVTVTRTTIDQRETLAIAATAIDTNGVDESTNATFSWSGSPTARVVLSAGSAPNRENALGLTSGPVTVTARATWKNVTKQGQIEITINALHYRITPSNSTPIVGDPVDLTVRVLRADSSVATTYTGEVAFTSGDPLATLPPTSTFTVSDAGNKTFSNIVIRKAGAVQITASDSLVPIGGSVTLIGQRILHAPLAALNATRALMHVDADASGSTDPDNDIANYSWDWGDGSATGPQASPVASHDYTAANPYTIVLTVTDATGHTDVAAKRVTVASSTIDYSFYDFFAVPYGDFWDLRSQLYYELPIDAECFNATAIAQGVCTPSNQNVADSETYPYTEWYSPSDPSLPSSNPSIYAPYRFRVTGMHVPGYNVSEPVFLPVLNYSAPPGNRLDFSWEMQYMNKTVGDEKGIACQTNYVFGNDGYVLDSEVDLVMDLAESKRIFGVVASNPSEAGAWWTANTDPNCVNETGVETALTNWLVSMGGGALPRQHGKYEIYNGYEWYYQPYATNVSATVDPDGTTHVHITHLAYGTETLLARFFYWGNASYAANYLDSRAARGWWGMENAWFEDLTFTGTLSTAYMDFALRAVEQYHLQHVCGPGPDGTFDRTDDVPQWIWGPWLDDYVPGSSGHPYSEIDRYPTETFVHCTPGAYNSTYGQSLAYDITPITWNLKAGQTWHFQFPTGNVIYFDPNLTPAGADPVLGEYHAMSGPMRLSIVSPSGYGTPDPLANTYDVIGPSDTGGPDGSPGNYPLDPWPQLTFATASGAGAASAVVPLTVVGAGEPSAGASATRLTTSVGALSLWSVLATANPARRIGRTLEVVV